MRVDAVLGDNHERFDLIASADTLVYFGDLDAVVSAAAGALRSTGLLIFTLERAAGAAEGVDHRLEFHGRYAHARAYVERVLAASGLRAHILEADLRMESGMPVAGLVVRAAKATRAAREPTRTERGQGVPARARVGGAGGAKPPKEMKSQTFEEAL